MLACGTIQATSDFAYIPNVLSGQGPGLVNVLSLLRVKLIAECAELLSRVGEPASEDRDRVRARVRFSSINHHCAVPTTSASTRKANISAARCKVVRTQYILTLRVAFGTKCHPSFGELLLAAPKHAASLSGTFIDSFHCHPQRHGHGDSLDSRDV